MSDMMDPTDIFDADEIDNAIKIIENEIEAVKKNEVAEVKPAETPVQKEEYSVDSLITKALNYVENVNSQADDVYHLFYSPLATGRDRTDASKVAIVESLRLKNENINAITNLVNAKAKLEALKAKQQMDNSGNVFIQAASGSEVGINLANLRAENKLNS
jgi:hypothetical protein